ncbi:MAG: Fic family protein [Candidatus Wallbacteria bacterium]|nr:Fic family protein [Candidatus Wallbacteria bacterium]
MGSEESGPQGSAFGIVRGRGAVRRSPTGAGFRVVAGVLPTLALLLLGCLRSCASAGAGEPLTDAQRLELARFLVTADRLEQPPPPTLPAGESERSQSDRRSRWGCIDSPEPPSVARTFRARYARLQPLRTVPGRDLLRYFEGEPEPASRELELRSQPEFPAPDILETLDWIREKAGSMEAAPELVRDLHRRLNAHNPFLWHEARRLKDARSRHQLSLTGGLEVLYRLAAGKADVSAPLGEWRSPLFDQFPQDGFQRTRDGEWFFTERQYESLTSNPYFTLEAPPVRRFGRVHARLWYPDAREIPRLVAEAFDAFKRRVAGPIPDPAYLRAVFQLRMCLISIHPFADGNGRTVQALTDVLLIRAGLPPPLNAICDEFEHSFEHSFRRFVGSMDDWLSWKPRAGAGNFFPGAR